MENTQKLLFEDDTTPHWYIGLEDQRWIGPMTAADVYEKVKSLEITWAHYVWKPGQAEWKRICDVPTFQVAVPQQPPKGVQVKIQEAVERVPMVERPARKGATPPPAPAEPARSERTWYLHYNETQFGPFSQGEVDRFLRIGKIHGRVYAWRDGMRTWERLESIRGFDEAVAESKRVRAARKTGAEASASGSAAEASATRTTTQPGAVVVEAPSKQITDLRGAPRRPLVARIFLSNEEAVIVAVCRDISIGGMQVLTDRIPGAIGSRVKMNVSPSAPAAGEAQGGGIPPFVAEGTIVRILEDGLGFSFRFEKLPDQARKAIEDYIASTG